MTRSFYLFTNRNVMIWDENGLQDSRMIDGIDCYKLDKKQAQIAINSCGLFYISKWMHWSHEVTKKEIEYMLGLRTREKDINEQSR